GINTAIPAYLVAGYINHALGIDLTYKEEVYNVEQSIEAGVYFPVFYYKALKEPLEYKLIGVQWQGTTLLDNDLKNLNLLFEINSHSCNDDFVLLEQYVGKHALPITLMQTDFKTTKSLLYKALYENMDNSIKKYWKE
ncbi:MAG: hypothetical protein EBX41_07960, partial [Chitinophagia bacterium]|nr:hypothetical protein [Chitinophagia bacterium]